MKSKSINSKVITGAILASLIIGSSSIGVFAADTSNTTSDTSTTQHQRMQGRGFATKLDALVTAGTLTSDQKTAIENTLKPQGNFNGRDHKDMFKNKLSELVTAETLTSDEQTAIENALTNAGNEKVDLKQL